MGNWNTSSSDADAQSAAAAGADYGFGSRGTSRDTGDSGKDEGIAFISPTTGRASTGNWNVRQAKEAGVQSAVIDGRTLYGSNAALAALGDPSSQIRENVIAGYPAYIANKRAEQRFMDNWIGKDLTSRIREAADAAGIPRSEIPYLQGASFDDSFKDEEGTAIRFSAGRGEDIGLQDERSFSQKAKDFLSRKAKDVVEGGDERDFIIGVDTDPVTGFSTYSNPYQVVNENNIIDAIASAVSPLGTIDTKRLKDPTTGKMYAYSDVDLPFGIDKFAGILPPQIEEEQLLRARRSQQLDVGGDGGSIAVQQTQKPLFRQRPPMLGGFGAPMGLGLGLGFGDPSFYTSGLPLINQMKGLLR